LARLQFLSASLTLFILGASWAILTGGSYSWFRILLGYLVLLPGHLSVAFSNDYFDVQVDQFGNPSFFSGGSGVLVKHPELRKPARRIAIGFILCSLALACLYQAVFSPPFWFLGYVALGDSLGWFYSAPPLKFAYRGFGEFSTAFISGFLIPGMGYLVVKGNINLDGFLFTVPLLLYGLGFMVAVEIPDLESDLRGQKRTWVTRIGREHGFILVGILFLAATCFFFLFPTLSIRQVPINFHILGFFSWVPLGASLLGVARRPLEQQLAARFANATVAALAMFFILTDGYLIFMSVH
jgi:1,4-dihydroxy-2-naphthoate octaprenyltransferase